MNRAGLVRNRSFALAGWLIRSSSHPILILTLHLLYSPRIFQNKLPPHSCFLLLNGHYKETNVITYALQDRLWPVAL
jgi:hypothetical protein